MSGMACRPAPGACSTRHWLGAGCVPCPPWTWSTGCGSSSCRSRTPWFREVPLAALWRDAGQEVYSLIDEWIDLVAGLTGDVPEPKLPLRVASELELGLEDGETLCPDRKTVVWCNVLSGTVHCRGVENAQIDSESGWFPLGAGMWVRASGAARVATLPTASVADAEDVSRGLTGPAFDRPWRDLLEEREREAEAQRVMLRQRDLLQQQRKAEALSDLASVLEPQVAHVTGDSPSAWRDVGSVPDAGRGGQAADEIGGRRRDHRGYCPCLSRAYKEGEPHRSVVAARLWVVALLFRRW